MADFLASPFIRSRFVRLTFIGIDVEDKFHSLSQHLERRISEAIATQDT